MTGPRRMCLYHPHTAARRRGLCWACHSKHRRCGVPMPAMEAPGPAPWPLSRVLGEWAATLPPEVRAALLHALNPNTATSPEAA